jgi:DNA recombination protein RmuC
MMQNMTLIFILIGTGIFLFGALLLVFKKASAFKSDLQNQLISGLQSGLHSQFEDSLSRTKMELRQNLKHNADEFHLKLESMRMEVDKKLSQTSQMNFESLGFVSKRLEELQSVTGQVVGLTQGVRDLSKILESPKLRGAMGEFALREMLKDCLPQEAYEEQVMLDKKSKELVDAVIKLKEGWLCIDSKFPLTQAKRIFDEKLSDGEVAEARKLFAQDIKVMADSISQKYIIPEKTLDFAFMFIPAESVYYELMKDFDLHQYCLKKHVVPVSPNSFNCLLSCICRFSKNL